MTSDPATEASEQAPAAEEAAVDPRSSGMVIADLIVEGVLAANDPPALFTQGDDLIVEVNPETGSQRRLKGARWELVAHQGDG
jgi:hypothetical protein